MEQVHQVGAKVKGQYAGQQYSGTVRDGRPHMMNSSYMHFIDLDKPITVLGLERDDIVVSVFRQGRDAEFPQTIEAA